MDFEGMAELNELRDSLGMNKVEGGWDDFCRVVCDMAWILGTYLPANIHSRMLLGEMNDSVREYVAMNLPPWSVPRTFRR